MSKLWILENLSNEVKDACVQYSKDSSLHLQDAVKNLIMEGLSKKGYKIEEYQSKPNLQQRIIQMKKKQKRNKK